MISCVAGQVMPSVWLKATNKWASATIFVRGFVTGTMTSLVARTRATIVCAVPPL